MRSLLINLLLGLLFITSCSNPNIKTNGKKETASVILPYRVEIEANLKNVKSFPLSAIGRKIEYIPLETNAKSLIKRIVEIHFSKNYIFISDFDRLTQFDRKGKFIRQVGSNGRGPGEYIHVSSFCIDENSEKVYIMAWGIKSILEFDFNGAFKRSFNISFSSLQFLKKDSNNYVFVIPNSPYGADSEFRLIITDSMGAIKTKIKNHNRFFNKPPLLATVIPMYYFKDTIRILESRVDTLNTFENSKHKPYAIFNLGQSKMEADLSIPVQNLINEEFNNVMKNKIWIWTISENYEYLFVKFNLRLSDSTKLCIFNKKTLETTFLNKNGFENDLDNGVTFWPKYIYQDSILVDYQDAFILLEKIKKEHITGSDDILSKGLTETSNPVVIVVK
jgi:hypothetical protein